MDHCQIFICNNHRCISIRNLDRLWHVKNVIIFTILLYIQNFENYVLRIFIFYSN